MIKKSSVFDFLTHVMVIWGISLLVLFVFIILFGEDAKGYSKIFELGKDGLPVMTAMQFLLLAVVITLLRWLFFTDRVIKEMSIPKRSIGMFVTVIIVVGFLSGICGWFPINQVLPWVMFFISFFVCTFIGVLVSAFKEKSENIKMQEALERLKEESFEK